MTQKYLYYSLRANFTTTIFQDLFKPPFKRAFQDYLSLVRSDFFKGKTGRPVCPQKLCH
jgi:hypothetical protein